MQFTTTISLLASAMLVAAAPNWKPSPTTKQQSTPTGTAVTTTQTCSNNMVLMCCDGKGSCSAKGSGACSANQQDVVCCNVGNNDQNGLLNLNLNLALCDDPITIDIPITIL